MKIYWKSIIVVALLVLFLLLFFKVIPDIIEGNKLQLKAELKEKFNICLQGCMAYEDAIPYVNNTRVVYFDFCANDCMSLYNYERLEED